MKFFFLKFEIFYEKHHPTRHIKYKKIDFVPCNKSIMAIKLHSTNLERFIRRIKSPLTRYKRELYCALIVPNWSKWPKWKSLNPHNFTKNDHRWNIFSNLSSGQQYLLNDIKKFRQNSLVNKSKFVWRKKNPPRAQIFRYFRIESRNKKCI